MGEDHLARVEEVPPEGDPEGLGQGGSAVESVAHQGHAHHGQVGPNLVPEGPLDLDLQEGKTLKTTGHTVTGLGRVGAGPGAEPDMFGHDLHPLGVFPMRNHRQIDDPLGHHGPLDEGEVALVYGPLGARDPHGLEGLDSAGHHDQPGGLGVESVHEPRLAAFEAHRAGLGVTPEDGVGEGPRLVGAEGVGGHARGFVEHDHGLVLVAHHEDGLGGGDGAEILRGEHALDGDLGPLGQGVSLAEPAPVDPNLPLVEQGTDPGPGELGQEFDKDLVESLAGVTGLDGEAPRGVGRVGQIGRVGIEGGRGVAHGWWRGP